MLTAAGIPHEVTGDGVTWTVLVAAADAAHARAALAAYDRDAEAAQPPAASTGAAPYPWMSGASVGLALLALYGVTGPPADSRWFEHGAAVAGRITSEPWRAVTALTLHVDAVHVLGNAVASAVLVPALVQRLGLGVALLTMLVAGVLGTVLSAMVHAPDHVAIGASTATFGAVGALAALRLARGTGDASPGRGWVVISASVLLLVLLGTARSADVVAHAAGLTAGLAVGTGAGFTLRRPPAVPVQGALLLLTTLMVAAAWWRALR